MQINNVYVDTRPKGNWNNSHHEIKKNKNWACHSLAYIFFSVMINVITVHSTSTLKYDWGISVIPELTCFSTADNYLRFLIASWLDTRPIISSENTWFVQKTQSDSSLTCIFSPIGSDHDLSNIRKIQARTGNMVPFARVFKFNTQLVRKVRPTLPQASSKAV